MDGILGKVRFKQWDCIARLQRYGNGRPAILLVDAEDFSPIAKATVNVQSVALSADEVIVKDYAENEGMLSALIQAGLVFDTGRTVSLSKWVDAHICKLSYREVAS